MQVRIADLEAAITAGFAAHLADLARAKHSRVFFIPVKIVWTEFDHVLAAEAFNQVNIRGAKYCGAFESADGTTTIEASE